MRRAASKDWFEVSPEGLRQLQEGKPKHFIARELVQNAWDESTKKCEFKAEWKNGVANISVTDDSPEGFRDLSDAFTLFAPTYKRADPTKRGRFNLGEKQVLSVCESARISTTKGALFFDKGGRRYSRKARESGSEVSVTVRVSKREFEELLEVVKSYLVPEEVEFIVNGVAIRHREPFKVIEATLMTEIEQDSVLRRTQRKTKVHILKQNGKARLYEIGIPVEEIDCQFDIDVQQKVPLSTDRETVPLSYLSALYAEVLNATHEEVAPEQASDIWVREAAKHERISPKAVRNVIKKRYGEKVVVANVRDMNSIDEALSHGYKVVYGNEMSKEEWDNVRKAGAMSSSSEVFGSGIAGAKSIEPDGNMKSVEQLVRKIAERCLGIEVRIRFASWQGVAAQYGDRTLTFNVGVLGRKFFEPLVGARIIELVVHELAHERGHHTEASYHEAITKMTGQLVMLALDEPEFFQVNQEKQERVKEPSPKG